jgi:hypothetical protein
MNDEGEKKRELNSLRERRSQSRWRLRGMTVPVLVVVESRGSAVLVAEEVEPYSIGRYKGRGKELVVSRVAARLTLTLRPGRTTSQIDESLFFTPP